MTPNDAMQEMKAAGEAGIKAATDKVIVDQEFSVENSLSQPGLQLPSYRGT